MVAIVIAGYQTDGACAYRGYHRTIDANLVGGTVRSGSSLIGADAGELVEKKLDAPIHDSLSFF